MLAVFFLLLVLGLGHGQDNDLPSEMDIESSINRTIEEVERQLRADPSLPRLTRPEIVRYLHNITSQDLNSLRDQEKIEKARKLYQRALMVVLPYSGADSTGNLNDLYTKPPIVQMIPDSLKSPNDQAKVEEVPKTFSLKWEEERKIEQPSKTQIPPDQPKDNAEDNEDRKETIIDLSLPSADENLVSNQVTYKPSDQQSLKNQYKNHRETYSEVHTKVPLKETLRLDSAPVRFTFNLENLQKNALSTERTTAARYPVYKSNGNKNAGLEIVYSTSITELPTTKSGTRGVTIDHGTSKTSHNVLSSNQWQYNAPPSSTLKPTMPSKFDKVPFLPTINTDLEDPELGLPLLPAEAMSTDPKVAEAFVTTTERPTALYVTAVPTGATSKAKYSSTYSINSAGFRAVTPTGTTTMPMRPEVMDLLASIGLRPDNRSNVEDVYKKNKEIIENKLQIADTNGLQYNPVSSLSSTGPDPASILDQNTFNGLGSEIRKGVENLTPDVQLLFQRFGLQTSKLDQSTTSTERTTINFNDYTNFKPLPTSKVKDQEMKEFLARFGLGDGRKSKSMRGTTEAPSVIEAVPGSMRTVLENMGLIFTTARPAKNTPKAVRDMESTATSTYHVFKPHETKVGDERQRVKINELLDTVKMVQEGKADIQNVKKVANDLLEATRTLKDGPDPLKLEEIIKTYHEDVRNEIKRQQETETTTAGTTERTSTPSSSNATESVEATSDSENAATDQKDVATATTTEVTGSSSNLMALEESFGGTTSAPDVSLPPKRKSGLYFLVDWNTFLEVGEDEKEKVNLRFQPKVGDRTRFLPVTVP
nr:filamentous growth regulator 23 isoform X1 [Megalopta genalis]